MRKSTFSRIFQPRSIFASLFWFLGLGILVSNALLWFISYQNQLRQARHAEAYELGFDISSAATRFFDSAADDSVHVAPRLAWQIIDPAGRSRAQVLQAHGMGGWIETASELPVVRFAPSHQRRYAAVLSRSSINIAAGALDGQAPRGPAAMAEHLARLSREIAESGRHVKVVFDGPGGKLMLMESETHWKDEGPLSKYDFIFYVALILFFMGLPFVAGHIFSPIDELVTSLKEKQNDTAPLRISGPREITEVSAAVNALLAKLSRHLTDRLSFVAAISHDLGVPATRLRLRASLIQDEDLRERLIEDTNEMSAMIADSLNYLRRETTDEPPRAIDFLSLVQSIHQDFVDIGEEVFFDDDFKVDQTNSHALSYSTVPSMFSGAETRMDYTLHGPLTLTCKPRAIRRALSNVVDNAVKYGEAALLEVVADATSVLVKITDRGPGIPEEEMGKVSLPFYRLEKSRGRGTGGTGLGLAIVDAIIKDHDGFVSMENMLNGGLQVIIALPRNVDNSPA